MPYVFLTVGVQLVITGCIVAYRRRVAGKANK